ncbi:hypothetical protein HDV00_006678 [Rhizophlyctis rosea]|nr:hypothetical protein HDV00_006678 [Rhizophlyctis rosea]
MLKVPDTDAPPLATGDAIMSRTTSALSTPHTNLTPSRRSSFLPPDPDAPQPDIPPQDDPDLTTLHQKLSSISSDSLTSPSPTDILDQHEIEYQREVEERKRKMKEVLCDRSTAPASYVGNSRKEEMVLKFVENFSRQYVQLYPGRKELVLCPKNHFDVKESRVEEGVKRGGRNVKFVCTTIRPTQLPYKELYDYRGCARFVADYLSYEPLEPPHELPTTIPGPAYTLKLQSGNSFDYALVLASLLRGVGYDAYVVSGYASRDLTLMNETKTETDAVGVPSPTANRGNGERAEGREGSRGGEEGGGGGGKYKVKPPRMLRSSFLVRQEEKKRVAVEKEVEARRVRERMALEEEEIDDDELKGLRVHAWVLILPGKREVAESFFIEPPTGRIYPTDNENYLGVESVWSSANYWVNMQVCYDGLKGISFDLGDNAKWEFVLLDNTQPSSSSLSPADDAKDGDNASDEEDEETTQTEILDLPPSWVEKIVIGKEEFEARCPSGSKSVTYKNARIETFAEYHRNDGMVSRITFFADDLKDFMGEIREYFANRKDKLRERVRIPYIDKIHEFFDPGRPHGLKEHVILEGRTQEMHFYPTARSDGLVKRVEEAHKVSFRALAWAGVKDDGLRVVEIFTEREDFLTYRSVTYDTNDTDDLQQTRGIMIKMTEKFDHNSDVPAGTDAAKKTYFVKDDKIRVVYHREEGRIIPSSIEFKKPTAEQKNHFEVLNSFEVNPYTTPPKKQHLFAQLCALVRSEQACLNAIKLSEREVKEILQARQAEEKDVALVISVYDTIRNQTKLPSEEDKIAHKGEEEESKGTDLDYLSPFLVNYTDPDHLTREESMAVKDACLKSLKERLIEKANIIQGRLDEVTAEYQRRQLAYSRNADSMTVEETEEYVRFCNDALFRMHILEKRLAKHKEIAPERYVELDAKLRADPRLRPAFA